ncbi:RDD family protein [Yinghuangia seranimata]|uniref:RDD family protein n=1 Tax=Yinghuangia seranimata TaxID=408067 RepID=UPI00248B560B|nr:RDD family protein [Yinghuangia seranimata]MDI2131387.1 RDD family protein [Yinghuangia seranimata]
MSSSEPPPPDPFGKPQEPGRQPPYGGEQPPSYGQPPPGQEPPPGGPQPPYGQPPPGGAPPPGGQPPYGGGPYGQMPPPPGDYSQYQAGPTLAGSGKRFVARLVDFVVFFVIEVAVFFAFVGSDTDNVSFGKEIGAGTVALLLYFLYEGSMLNYNGQTLGKIVMHIRVVRVADGGSIHGSPAWTRAAVYSLPPIVPCAGIVFWIVDQLWHTWDQPWQQCLHDKAANTTVIRI